MQREQNQNINRQRHGEIHDGHIVEVSLRRGPGGQIRCDDLSDRVRFVESDLRGVRLADSLGVHVQFELVQTERGPAAVRVVAL